MATNRGFKNGHVPNWPASSNDVKGVVPEGGYGDWLGNHHTSYYHDGNYKKGSKIKGGPTNWEGEWHKDWSIGYIMGKSEIDSTMDRFGRGANMCQNDADNNSGASPNPSGFHKFFSGVGPNDCTVISKPLGQAYKSWVTYIGSVFFIDSNSSIGDMEKDTLKLTRINPMGFTFGYQCEHETGSAVANGYGLISLTALLILMYRPKTGEYKIAELASPNKDKMTQTFGMTDSKTGSLSGTKFPGYHRKVGGAGSLHDYSKPNPSRQSAAPQTLPPGQKIYRTREFIDPVTKKKVTRGTTMTNGAYGMEYYEFSDDVKDKIVKEDWRPFGVFFKWSGYSPDALYGDSDTQVSIFDVNYIAYNPKGWRQGYKFRRFNNEPALIDGDKVTKYEISPGVRAIEF